MLIWAMWQHSVSHPGHRTGAADLRINTSRPFPEARRVHTGLGVQSSADLRIPGRTPIRAAARADLKKETAAVSPTRGTSRTPGLSPTVFGASRGAICGRIRGAVLAINPGRDTASKQTQNLLRYDNSDLGLFSDHFSLDT